jgi:HEAT repeat protein
MNAREVIDLLEGENDVRRRLKERIAAEAPLEAIVSAMRVAMAPLTRQILCDIAGARLAVEALPELVAALDDASPAVRSAAADALAAIRDPTTGPALLRHYRSELDSDVRTILAVALGAVGCRPAIPDLILALNDPHRALQIEAAWSLGELRATEAREQIAGALSRQTTDWSRRLMEDALAKLDV